MNLKKKKELVARVLKVGKGKVILDSSMKDEIKEAITRQDIKDLKQAGAIKIKEKKGRRKKKKRKTKKGEGKRKKKIKREKQEYVKLIRKLRAYIKNLRDKEKISKEDYREFRKKIRARVFRDLAHLKEAVKEKLK